MNIKGMFIGIGFSVVIILFAAACAATAVINPWIPLCIASTLVVGLGAFIGAIEK